MELASFASSGFFLSQSYTTPKKREEEEGKQLEVGGQCGVYEGRTHYEDIQEDIKPQSIFFSVQSLPRLQTSGESKVKQSSIDRVQYVRSLRLYLYVSTLLKVGVLGVLCIHLKMPGVLPALSDPSILASRKRGLRNAINQ